MRERHQHLKNHQLDAWLARGAVLLIVALQVAFVNDLSVGPWWLAPAIELALLIPLSIGTAWTQRSVRQAETDNAWSLVRNKRKFVRRLATVLTGFSTVINFIALALLMRAIVNGHAGTGRTLLLDAVNIWVTNVVVFALWYWILDRGGPSSRGLVPSNMRDFLFTQQQGTDQSAGFVDWLPGFIDYVFLAFTNATAFSPADTFPLTARAKLLMMAESTISLITVAVVASRAVGILN
ncbi:hypothetical protein [Bradyrhizobium genosp. A]|uniref:hypothetical protein n=1 Tax=Bradyrhizobium genosp. A TaxID=83626 RepID=UPI003CEEA2E0